MTRIHLTRAEGSEPQDFQLSRRGVAALMFAGYAAYAASAEAAPVHTDEAGLIIEQITIPSAGADLPLYVARPASAGRHPTVIVINEIFGVHEWIRDVCRRLAHLGYVAVAPAFFFRADREGKLPGMTNFGDIIAIVKQASDGQVMGDVRATLQWLEAQPFVDKKRLAVTGFCWGGGKTWRSCESFADFKCGVAWYGPLKGDVIDHAAELKAPVLGLYGGLDKGIPETDIDAMRASLKADGKTGSDIIVFPKAEHGFLADYRPSYNEEAAKDAWSRMLAFFRAHGV